MIDLKESYNELLVRYYKGCDYLEANPQKWDKYYPTLEEILEEMNQILIYYKTEDEETILYGYKQ